MRNVHRTALALGGLLFFYPLARVDAHAILLAAAPASNETVRGAAVHVRLRFNARIDAKRSQLSLVLPGGGERILAADQPSPDILACEVHGLGPGSYVLRWQVLAEDGHITHGLVPFRAQ